jgi:hypothetical protein
VEFALKRTTNRGLMRTDFPCDVFDAQRVRDVRHDDDRDTLGETLRVCPRYLKTEHVHPRNENLPLVRLLLRALLPSC